jgi:hypothetical protein
MGVSGPSLSRPRRALSRLPSIDRRARVQTLVEAPRLAAAARRGPAVPGRPKVRSIPGRMWPADATEAKGAGASTRRWRTGCASPLPVVLLEYSPTQVANRDRAILAISLARDHRGSGWKSREGQLASRPSASVGSAAPEVERQREHFAGSTLDRNVDRRVDSGVPMALGDTHGDHRSIGRALAERRSAARRGRAGSPCARVAGYPQTRLEHDRRAIR